MKWFHEEHQRSLPQHTYSAFWDQKYDINKSNGTITTSLTQLNVCYILFNHIHSTWQITGVKKSEPHMLWRKKSITYPDEIIQTGIYKIPTLPSNAPVVFVVHTFWGFPKSLTILQKQQGSCCVHCLFLDSSLDKLNWNISRFFLSIGVHSGVSALLYL